MITNELVERLRSKRSLDFETLSNLLEEAADCIEGLEDRIAEKQKHLENLQKVNEDLEKRIAIMSEGGWIPVEERLPEIKKGKEYFGTECIVCDKWKQVFALRYCKHIVRGKEVYRWMRYDMSIYYGEVVYWMPFPEPPKEGKL